MQHGKNILSGNLCDSGVGAYMHGISPPTGLLNTEDAKTNCSSFAIALWTCTQINIFAYSSDIWKHKRVEKLWLKYKILLLILKLDFPTFSNRLWQFQLAWNHKVGIWTCLKFEGISVPVFWNGKRGSGGRLTSRFKCVQNGKVELYFYFSLIRRALPSRFFSFLLPEAFVLQKGEATFSKWDSLHSTMW